MNIPIVCQYWPPETGAPAGRFYDIGRQWVAGGHGVSVIADFPSSPSGSFPRSCFRKPYQHEVMDGIDVHRTYMFSSPEHTDMLKALGHSAFAFVVSSSLFSLINRIQYDVVITTSPPPTMGFAGWLAARKRRVPLVLDVRDVWPDALVNSGRIKSPLVARLLGAAAARLHKSADLVSVVTTGKRSLFIELGVPAEKLVLVPNGVDVELFDHTAEGPLPPEFDALDQRARWLTYAGSFNSAQGLHVILEVANLLRQQRPDLYSQSQFVLIGGGSQLPALRKMAEQLDLDRLAFIPIQPRTVVFRVLRRSFGVMVTLLPRGNDHTIPAKLYEALASGRPTILSAAGEAGDVVNGSGGGYTVAPGDASQLCQAITDLLQDPAAVDGMGSRGHGFVADNFDRRRIADQYAQQLESLNSKRSPDSDG